MVPMVAQGIKRPLENEAAGEAAAAVPKPKRLDGHHETEDGTDVGWETTIEVSPAPSGGTRSQVAKRKASDEPPSASAGKRSRSSTATMVSTVNSLLLADGRRRP